MTTPETPPTIQRQVWGQLPSGEPVHLYLLQSKSVKAWISDYGGRLIRLQTPDRNGTWGDVVLGHDQLEPYLQHEQATYYGALIGRFGNRIAGGRFELDGQTYQLATNNGPNALHGGPGGFHAVLWNAQIAESSLLLTYTSPDGEEGYPGILNVSATYRLDGSALSLAFRADSDAPTILNLTHHPFWSLQGGAGDILDHELSIDAERYTPVNSQAIPTGELAPVEGTPFDFRAGRRIGEQIGAGDEQLEFVGGYDHNFVLGGEIGTLRRAATLSDPGSGRRLEVHSTQPGVQFYSGNFSNGTFVGFGGQVYQYRSSVCLEPQHFPDSPNQTDFPSTVLEPGEIFESLIEYRFSSQ